MVSSKLGRLDILVNNAGYAIAKTVLEHEVRSIEELFLINVIRPIQLIVRLVKYMGEGSTIINIVTAGIHIKLARMPIYGSSKVALHYASKILRDELRSQGIRLMTVYPSPVRTKFFERAGLKTPKYAIDPSQVAKP